MINTNYIIIYIFLFIFISYDQTLYTYQVLNNFSELNYNMYMISILFLNSLIIISKIIANLIYNIIMFFLLYAPIDEY